MRFVLPLLLLAATASAQSFGAQSFNAQASDAQAFRVAPYLQQPTTDGITVRWVTDDGASPGTLTVTGPEGETSVFTSEPAQADLLAYPLFEVKTNEDEFADTCPDPDNQCEVPAAPFMHRVVLEGLEAGGRYTYTVEQDGEVFEGSFRTAPDTDTRIRFIAFADSETEPESTDKFARWADPNDPTTDRRYPITEEIGYANNLDLIREAAPDFIVIAGDLVESGGEQRDWDAFWAATAQPDASVAGTAPILPTLGNHEYYSSPHANSGALPKEYRQPFSEEAIDRYLAYFDLPDNGSDTFNGRYYRFDYGPVTLLSVDANSNGANGSGGDTNFFLLGADDPDGGNAPSFSVGSDQYIWLEAQLAEAQQEARFTFVAVHPVPYSVGPHGQPAGEFGEPGLDPISGVPVQELTPLFLQYGVDALFAGHDEMWERSVVEGEEVLPDGTIRAHELHVYDLGTGGDGLRGPTPGVENPFQQFLAHDDAPEVWNGSQLVSGGKHYGHLDVTVEVRDNRWTAELVPVYAFPLLDENGDYLGFERRVYEDIVTLVNPDSVSTVETEPLPDTPRLALGQPYPNPSAGSVNLPLTLDRPAESTVRVYDLLGRKIAVLHDGLTPAGSTSIRWAADVPAGTYIAVAETTGQVLTRRIVVL